ncbi:uncharacterized protein LOC127714936 [Mytilus californianus]|uniref:uncharacterized protein LOC127714936 n=1 Tax=Mytilus californianus TaxID=6549 RepID=UPI0022482F8E|nr:uncharacterized protein LOC127714936 [Mytilus californianus]
MAADDQTQSLSLWLYHYLCQNIVGYEDYVKTIRMMNNARDNLDLIDGYVCITSGSFGEGLELEGSDIDIMQVMKEIKVYEHRPTAVQKNDKAYFSIDMEGTKPGFAYLLFEYTRAVNVLPMCINVRGKLCLSNVLFKQMFRNTCFTVDHGPCLSDKEGLYDLCFCLHSKSWISAANQWITRPNNSWPSDEVKQSIIDHGVLFVPIGMKGSENEEVEWCLSYSVGEKLLIYAFSHTQLLCYALLKILLKDVINIDMRCKGLLCSYFLKTIVFWVSEELQPSVWTQENLLPCFMGCFRRLLYCVEYSVCPHYFIPEYNLFENKIRGNERQLLLNNLYALHSNDWRCILFSPQITQFGRSPNLNFPITPFICSFQKVVSSKNLLILKNMHLLKGNTRKRYVRTIHNLLFLQSSKIKSIHLHFMSVVCENMPQAIPLIKRDGNKYQYKQYNTWLSYLLQNTHQDSVSKWLMLASFFYRTQQYNKALYLTLYSLSKCTLEKLCHGKDLSDIHFEVLSLETIRKKGITNLMKLLRVKSCVFVGNSLIPTELQMDVYKDFLFCNVIPAVVCANFLRVLCHYHLNNIRQCRKAVSDLGLTIAEEHFIPNIIAEKSYSYDCFGVALQLICETEKAKQAFLRSIELVPERELNVAYQRLYEIVKDDGPVLVLKRPNLQYIFED